MEWGECWVQSNRIIRDRLVLLKKPCFFGFVWLSSEKACIKIRSSRCAGHKTAINWFKSKGEWGQHIYEAHSVSCNLFGSVDAPLIAHTNQYLPPELTMNLYIFTAASLDSWLPSHLAAHHLICFLWDTNEERLKYRRAKGWREERE